MNEMNVKLLELVDDPETERYCFANQMELLLYARQCREEGKKNPVIWLAESTYRDLYRKGFILFESGRYADAIRTLQDALKVNPVGIDARFEMCECYLRLGLIPGARQILLDMQDYLVEPHYIARFYRRLGFIASEQRKLRLAAACLQFSLEYEEKKAYVRNELRYLAWLAGKPVRVSDPEKVIRIAGLPVLEAMGAGTVRL